MTANRGLPVIAFLRLAARMPHAELLALDGLYAKLWSHHSGGFLAEDLSPDELEALS